jgi:hypothetical protein
MNPLEAAHNGPSFEDAKESETSAEMKGMRVERSRKVRKREVDMVLWNDVGLRVDDDDDDEAMMMDRLSMVVDSWGSRWGRRWGWGRGRWGHKVFIESKYVTMYQV